MGSRDQVFTFMFLSCYAAKIRKDKPCFARKVARAVPTKNIPGHPDYAVDENGVVTRIISPTVRRMAPEIKVDGETFRLSRLVAQLFLPKPPFPDPVVFHRDGDSTNCAASNLVWVPRPYSNIKAFWEHVREVVAANPDMQVFDEEVFE